MDDRTFGTLVAVTRHFEDTGILRTDALWMGDRERDIVANGKLTVSEPIETRRLYISARLPEICRAIYRATGEPRSGPELDYVLAYARANHIRPAAKPQWVKR